MKKDLAMKNILLSCGIALLIIVPTCCTKKIVTSNIPPAPRVVHNAHLPEGWYAHDPIKLNAEIDSYFACAAKEFVVPVAASTVRALIVPHAGHYYSGLCAASAYQTLFKGIFLQQKMRLRHVNKSKITRSNV